MMEGMFYINGYDAYTEFGITLQPGARAALMTPSALKEPIKSSSRMEHGTRYLAGGMTRVAEREFTLNLNLTARSEEEFLLKYDRLCRELERETLDIQIKEREDETFHCIYRSCTQYQEWGMGVAKFALRLIEPNPKDRAR